MTLQTIWLTTAVFHRIPFRLTPSGSQNKAKARTQRQRPLNTATNIYCGNLSSALLIQYTPVIIASSNNVQRSRIFGLIFYYFLKICGWSGVKFLLAIWDDSVFVLKAQECCVGLQKSGWFGDFLHSAVCRAHERTKALTSSETLNLFRRATNFCLKLGCWRGKGKTLGYTFKHI